VSEVKLRELNLGEYFRFPEGKRVCRLDQADQPSMWGADRDPERYWRWTDQFGYWGGDPGDTLVIRCDPVEFVNHYDHPCDKPMPAPENR